MLDKCTRDALAHTGISWMVPEAFEPWLESWREEYPEDDAPDIELIDAYYDDVTGAYDDEDDAMIQDDWDDEDDGTGDWDDNDPYGGRDPVTGDLWEFS